MSHRYEDEEFSGSENDDAFDEDLEALRRACMVVGADPNDLNKTDNRLPAAPSVTTNTWSSDSEDDLELVRNIQNRLALSNDVCQPLSLEALCALPPVVSDDEEDDFETLRFIQRRFSAYNSADTKNSSVEDFLETPKQVHESTTSVASSEDNNSNNLFENIINSCEEGCNETITNISEPTASDADWHQSDECRLSVLPQKQSNFPQSAQLFIDAIKKNRSYQKFLRSKLTQIESRIEENNKLKERVKILKDFQVSCRKITGRALSQKKDLRVQLISACKSRNSKDSEGTDKKLSAINYGPAENSQVSNYKIALTKSPLSLHRKKWSKKENENLGKGIRQQFQEMVLQLSVDRFSVAEGSTTDTNSLDSIFASIKELEVTPEMIREFLPKVNWEQLASMYVQGRSGAECETRWLNYEDPLINHNPWTAEEDKSLLLIVQEKGITDWFDIAFSLGTNRTPFQCLARYQRSLNTCIMKREWTKEEDEQLRIAVEAIGENNWQFVASNLKGRTGTQCSNRWNKTLHPSRERQGRWNPDEDKRLTVATLLFGPRNWKKIAQFVPGRTQVQCRERWVNSLDPSVKRSEWTEQEDLKLEEAIKEHGYCWSKVAAALPSRTDNQCWRRWKVLHPEKVPLFLEAKKMQKAALISNFVDREKERPAIGPNDFIPIAMLESASQPDGLNSSKKRKRKSRKPESGKENDDCHAQKKIKSLGDRSESQVCSERVLGMTDSDMIETNDQHDPIQKKRTVKPRSGKKKAYSLPDATKKSSKKGSKRQCSAELDESSQSILLRPPKNGNRRTTNDEGKNLSLEVTKKAQNRCHGRKICNEQSSECQDVQHFSYHQDANKTSKPRSEPHSKNLSQASEGDDITLACFLRKKSKKRRLEVPIIADHACSSSCKETMGSLLSFEAVDQHKNERQIQSQMQTGEARMYCNGGTHEDMSPCRMQLSHLKGMPIMVASDKCTIGEKVEGGIIDKVESGVINYHEPVIEATMNINLEDDIETGDITLACWLNKSSLNMQSGHLKDMQKDLAIDKELARGDLVKGAATTPHEPVREPMNNNIKDELDDADVTLAVLRSKLKRR